MHFLKTSAQLVCIYVWIPDGSSFIMFSAATATATGLVLSRVDCMTDDAIFIVFKSKLCRPEHLCLRRIFD